MIRVTYPLLGSDNLITGYERFISKRLIQKSSIKIFLGKILTRVK